MQIPFFAGCMEPLCDRKHMPKMLKIENITDLYTKGQICTFYVTFFPNICIAKVYLRVYIYYIDCEKKSIKMRLAIKFDQQSHTYHPWIVEGVAINAAPRTRIT